jgi:hypothetical protein
MGDLSVAVPSPHPTSAGLGEFRPRDGLAEGGPSALPRGWRLLELSPGGICGSAVAAGFELGEPCSPPFIDEGARRRQSRGVTLVGADLDESPMAYRRLPEVLAHHTGSVKVLHTLRPFAVAMAGEGEFDPFKD